MSQDLTRWFDKPIAFHRIFVDLTGSVQAALMLSQALYWSKRTKSEVGWFYKSSSEWEEETGLGRHEQDTARKRLRATSFWKEKLAGVPATCHFMIDIPALFSSLSELDKPVSDSVESATKEQSSMPESGNHSITENTTENTLFDDIQMSVSVKEDISENRTTKGKAKAKKKPEKEADPAFKPCVAFWLKEFHPDWSFNAGEGKALKEILKLMRKYSFKKNDQEITTENLINFFKHFCSSLPEFYKSQNLKVLCSKFDSIIDLIKSGRDQNQTFRNKPSNVSVFSNYY